MEAAADMASRTIRLTDWVGRLGLTTMRMLLINCK